MDPQKHPHHFVLSDVLWRQHIFDCWVWFWQMGYCFSLLLSLRVKHNSSYMADHLLRILLWEQILGVLSNLRDSLSSPNTQCCFLQYCFGKYFSLSLFDWVAHGTFRCSILRPRYNPKVGLHVWQFDSSTNLWRFSSGPEIWLCRVYWQFQFHTVEF